MESDKKEYKLQMYREIKEIVKGKIYLVINEIDNKVYVKKILGTEYYEIYEKLKENENKNRAKIKDIFIIDGKLFVIEEFINGENLSVVIENKKLNEEEILNIIESICNGLEDLHRLNSPIIHKDIKPENIMVSNDGIIKLIDFDAGRIVRSDKEKDTRLLGTRGYASPEQFGFSETDNRTDIYSLGVLLNYLLIGKFPNEEIADGKFNSIIKKATEIDREKRYKNIGEFKKAINDTHRLEFYEGMEIDRNEKWIRKLKFEKKQKKGIVGYRSKNTIKMIIASLYYAFAAFGMGLGITGKSLGDIVVAVYLFVFPTAVFGDISYLNKIFKNLNVKKYSLVIRIIIGLIVTIVIGLCMPQQ
ncbi:MAG: serine/threonine-protein kinase [Clostridium sp.]|uniref:serine/threonine-protein kinase n=1 Tax=Clostridium sp. TaxID=1506 RepID=UPI003EE44424